MTAGQALLLAAVSSSLVGGLVLFLAYRNWYLPLRAWLRAERLRREEALDVPPSPRDYQYSITFDAEGFTVVDIRGRGHESATMQWIEVQRAVAFKRDLFTVDCICVSFARADGTTIEVNEEMARWRRFVESIPEHLPDCKPWSDWFSIVAFPPFAPSETVLYERSMAVAQGVASGGSPPINHGRQQGHAS